MLYVFEDFVLDTDKRELRRGADLISVAPQVFDVLDYLIRNRERVVSKDDLVTAIWEGRIISDAALTTRLKAVRSAISDSGEEQRLIKTLPRKGFRFVGRVQEEQRPGRTLDGGTPVEPPGPVLALPDKPSIAVLPFSNLSGDPKEDYFCDGITEDIITELSRFSELFVIAHNSSFTYKGRAVDLRQVGKELGVCYVLEGSIRRVGDRVRITGQLVDATTGAHRWAERYDRKLEDVFAVQDEVAQTIAGLLAAHVNKAEAERALLKPPSAWQAYDYYIRAADLLARHLGFLNIGQVYQARQLLAQATSADSNHARAYATLSFTHWVAFTTPLDADYLSRSALETAYKTAHQAVQLDPHLPKAHAQLGLVLTYRREHDLALAEVEQAIALNPNFTDYRFGPILLFAGEPRRAVDTLVRHMRLDPFYAPVASAWLGAAYYMLGRYAEAVKPLQQCASRAPNQRLGRSWLAATYAQLGQMSEARGEANQVLRIDPKFTIGTRRPLVVFKDRDKAEHYFDGLRKAGLPEQ